MWVGVSAGAGDAPNGGGSLGNGLDPMYRLMCAELRRHEFVPDEDDAHLVGFTACARIVHASCNGISFEPWLLLRKGWGVMC